MKLEILNEVENKLFNRKEITAKIDAEITPSHDEVEKLLVDYFKTNAENIKIKKIEGKFGSKTFTIILNIYVSKQDKDAVEIKKKWEIERDKKPAEPIKEETKPEEKPEPVKEEPKEDQLTDKNQSSEASENKPKEEKTE